MTTLPVLAVTVLGTDRPGIVADVTAALAGIGGNLEDSTMTLLRGHFAMVVLVRPADAPPAAASGDGGATGDREDAVRRAVGAALAPLTADGSLVVDVRSLPEAPPSGPDGAAFTLRVHGADRPGIVAALTRVVADHGGTIVDLGTRLSRGLYVLTAELVLPVGATPARLEADLAVAAREVGVDVHLDPVDDDLL